VNKIPKECHGLHGLRPTSPEVCEKCDIHCEQCGELYCPLEPGANLEDCETCAGDAL